MAPPARSVVRGPNVLFEYWGNQAATSEALRDGWYHSGDIGTRDADGYFTIHDRKKNMIISGGENVYPAEIERVLHEHPGRRRSGGDRPRRRATGRRSRSPTWCGGRAAAVDAEEIRQHVAAQLARFKVPRDVVFVETLPRNALGKVQHFLLKQAEEGH